MTENKGYGVVIPSDWERGRWDALAPQDIISQLKKLNSDAFYRMAADIDIDLALLEQSGYEYNGISQIAVTELEAYLPEEKLREVMDDLPRIDYQKDSDFQYVFHLYNKKNDLVAKVYPPATAEEILKSHDFALRDERDNVRKLMALFIDEFEDDKTEARKRVLKEYGGHFISIPELDSFLAYRDDVEWYKGDTFDPEYRETVEQMKAMRDLIPLYKLLRDGGDFQIQSTKYKHQKVSVNKESAEILSDAVALALKMLYDKCPYLSSKPAIDKTYTWLDLIGSRIGNEVDDILESVNLGINSYESEFNLSLFYYLADNAIQWPKGITLTKRYLFLYKLAKFFKFIPESEYDKVINISTRKEIVEAIKYQIKQMKNRDKDGEIIDRYHQ